VKLRTKVSVKCDGKWLPVGSVIDRSKDEARSLIDKGVCVPCDTGADIDPEVDPQGAAVEALCKLDGVNKTVAEKLIAAGYDSPDALRDAEVSADDLTDIEGIGEKTADRIIDALND